MARLLFLGNKADVPYLHKMKPLVRTSEVFVITESLTTMAELELYCQKRDITGIITTSTWLLSKLMPTKDWSRKLPSLDAYAGSYFKTPKGVEVVAIHALEQMITVPYSTFLTEKFISKLTAPEEWDALRLPTLPQFKWTLVTASNWEECYDTLSKSDYIAVDIETKKDPVRITCIGFASVQLTSSGITVTCFVVPIDSEFAVSCCRKFASIQAPKILQNGKYDISYLLRYNIILWGYMYDTATMFHSWLAELPKDLAFQSAFLIRDGRYWKDLAQTDDLQEYYKYNALDCWSTALAFLSWIQQAPEWAQRNYLSEFPINFPCILSEMTGIKRDMEALEKARAEQDAIIESANNSLETMLGVRLNSNSPKQVKTLFAVLGLVDKPFATRPQWDSTDEKHIQKGMYMHPLNARILGKILDIRGARKLASTYLSTDADKSGAKEFNGRILYSLIPHGTDTGRLASREHHFWCGLQLQNIPRGDDVKQTLCADDDFLFGEADLEQAESRDTAHIAGDEKLIAAVSGINDFHAVNASAFFGIPYDKIFDNTSRKTLDKALRDLAKRVNHGANYNMGAGVLVDTMGLEKIYEAKRLLNLPKPWGVKEVAEHLLSSFHKTYSGIAGNYYVGMVFQLVTTRHLASKAIHIPHEQDAWSASCYDVKYWYESTGGWTRRCFGDPERNKSHKNAYIAHEPQSLNAMTLNKAYMRVFYEIAIHPQHSKNFKLLGQIHDSIPHQYRKGHEYLSERVARCMEIPVIIQGYDGKVRTFTVPSANKCGKKYWSELG
jgi:DNA polymerase I-like protein with 3'-5' exonuclease and polymerase domains